MNVSKIQTEIRDSQGGLIALDSDSYVMYKIISTLHTYEQLHEWWMWKTNQHFYKVGGKMQVQNVFKKKKNTKEIFNVGCNCEKKT